MKDKIFLGIAILLGAAIVFLSVSLVASAQDADLPIRPPRLGDKPEPTPTPHPPEPPVEQDPSTPPPTIYGETIHVETDSILYVIDLSCSMDMVSGDITTLDGRVKRGTRYEAARVELLRSINGLSPNLFFNVLAYDCHTETAFPSPREATPDNKERVKQWLSEICWRDDTYITRIGGGRFGGGTGTGPAVSAGLLMWPSNKALVLLTDGEPNCGAGRAPNHRTMIAGNNRQGATINVFGIEAFGEWRAFCQGVASDSGGLYKDVP